MKLFITWLSWTGKSTILQQIKTDRRFKWLILSDIDEYLPTWYTKSNITDRDAYELVAATQAIDKNVDIFVGNISWEHSIKYLAEHGYIAIALVMSSEKRRHRINKRALQNKKRALEFDSIASDEADTIKELAERKWWIQINADEESSAIVNQIWNILSTQ